MNDVSAVVENTVPVLGVSNFRESIRFYTEVLGFALDWEGSDEAVCGMSRDGHGVMLCTFAKPGGWVWIGVTDDSLFEKSLARGVPIVQQPQNSSWAYEMKFEDPDGNVIWLGTGPREDLPVSDQSVPAAE